MKYLILIILLTSCVSNKINRKLKRAERLTNEAIALGAKIQSDTIYSERLVFVDSIRVDSIFTAKVGDTVYLTKDRLKVKYVRLPGDSVFIEGKCEADTIKIEVPISVNKEIKSGLSVLVVVQWSILALIIGAVLYKVFWK